MNFSVLIWNIWLDNQINGEVHSEPLLAELGRLVELYQPDFIGLNEVLQNKNSYSPFILEYLNNVHGYTFSHFAPASPFNDEWDIGAAFCSKITPKNIHNLVLSKDTPAERRGYPGFELKAISAEVKLGDTLINIVVAHPMHLKTYTLWDHFTGTKTLENLVRSKGLSKNTILGGDFNEPRFMPKSFKNAVRDVMHMKTGTFQNATWRFNAKPHTLLRANLDQLYWSKNSDFELTSFEVVDSPISDHRPIIATFTLK